MGKIIDKLINKYGYENHKVIIACKVYDIMKGVK